MAEDQKQWNTGPYGTPGQLASEGYPLGGDEQVDGVKTVPGNELQTTSELEASAGVPAFKPLDSERETGVQSMESLAAHQGYTEGTESGENEALPAEIGSPVDIEQTERRAREFVEKLNFTLGEHMPVEAVASELLDWVMAERKKAADTAEYLQREKHQITE